jgi:hypothetical protein
MATHYHVVEFINGCLNDYDSGPIETLELARESLAYNVSNLTVDENLEPTYAPSGVDRYVRGLHTLKIEECTERECEDELHGV